MGSLDVVGVRFSASPPDRKAQRKESCHALGATTP
jgi:hypothetical protein